MNAIIKTLLAAVLVALGLPLSIWAAEPPKPVAPPDGALPSPGFQPLRYIGYWHDGSGVFRGCTPVTTWNEWDFKEVTSKNEDGKTVKTLVPDKENRVNIVWKVPHYNWCNGGMIIAGGKLFAMSDRGGLGFYGEREADFVGAELFCYDPADGKLLWKKDLDHWDLVPNGAALREKVRDYNRRIVPILKAWFPISALNKRRLTEESFLRLAPAMQALAPEFPKTWADFTKINKLYNDSYPFWTSHSLQEMYFPDLYKELEELGTAGQYMRDCWMYANEFLGINMQTPVSDGKRIYIQTAYGAVFCLDLDGRIIWKRWEKAAMARGVAIPSPILVGDLLIGTRGTTPFKGPMRMVSTTAGPQHYALRTSDGSEVWAIPAEKSFYRQNPVVMSLPIAGDSQKRLEILIYHDGTVVRARDGKILVKESIASSGHARPWAVWQDVIVLTNRRQDGGNDRPGPHEPGILALRLTATSEDVVTATALWNVKTRQGFRNLPIVRDGLAYLQNQYAFEVRDAVTGEVLDKTKGNTSGTLAFQYQILAGDHLIGMDSDGRCSVTTLAPDGRSIKGITINRLGDRIYGQSGYFDLHFNYGSQPFASGNRLFIRSNRELYCIGNPAEPLRLSPEHR